MSREESFLFSFFFLRIGLLNYSCEVRMKDPVEFRPLMASKTTEILLACPFLSLTEILKIKTLYFDCISHIFFHKFQVTKLFVHNLSHIFM